MSMQSVLHAIIKAKQNQDTTLKITREDIDTLPPQIGELTDLQSLSLKNNGLTHLPDEIGNLTNLRVLSLVKNQLAEIPECVCKLSNLEELFVSRNQIISLPAEIGNLKNLKTLSLIRNKIKALPPEIGELLNLRALLLRNNELTQLPSAIVKLTQLKTLEVADNPLRPPLDEVAKNGVYALMSYMLGLQFGGELHDYVAQHLFVRDELKTALHQYLVYFVDYVRSAKGQDIDFQVLNIPAGLELRLKSEGDQHVHNVASYLQEYVSLVGQNLDSLAVNIEAEIDPTEQKILMVELRNQIRMLQSSVEIRNVKIDYLKGEVEFLRQSLQRVLSRPSPILISASAASYAESTALAQASAGVVLAELQESFASLTDGLAEMAPQLSNPLQDIVAELDRVDEDIQDAQEIEKPLLGRIYRILSSMQDPDSELGRTVRTIRSCVRAGQKAARAYNKLAQWLALPQVPDVFL